MSRFRQTRRALPGLNMAAMPDLIFTVLFFFMIVTNMRDVQPLVQAEVPRGSEVEETQHKQSVVYLFIGKPIDAMGRVTSQETAIQLNNRLVSIDRLEEEIAQERAALSDDERPYMVVSIRADRDTEMGIISDVKQALRRAGALNITYSANAARNPQKNN